jgi:hypothetical protein
MKKEAKTPPGPPDPTALVRWVEVRGLGVFRVTARTPEELREKLAELRRFSLEI